MVRHRTVVGEQSVRFVWSGTTIRATVAGPTWWTTVWFENAPTYHRWLDNVTSYLNALAPWVVEAAKAQGGL